MSYFVVTANDIVIGKPNCVSSTRCPIEISRWAKEELDRDGYITVLGGRIYLTEEAKARYQAWVG